MLASPLTVRPEQITAVNVRRYFTGYFVVIMFACVRRSMFFFTSAHQALHPVPVHGAAAGGERCVQEVDTSLEHLHIHWESNGHHTIFRYIRMHFDHCWA